MAGSPTWTPGQVLTASLVTSWLAPVSKVKTSNEIINNSTTIQNDDELVVSVEANATYLVQVFARVSGPDAGDFKWKFVGPASATNVGTGRMIDGTNLDTREYNDAEQGIQLNSNFGVHSFDYVGWCRTSGTAGTLQFQWAQSTATVGDTTVFTGSFMVLQRVA